MLEGERRGSRICGKAEQRGKYGGDEEDGSHGFGFSESDFSVKSVGLRDRFLGEKFPCLAHLARESEHSV
jgi:hypothetical protein